MIIAHDGAAQILLTFFGGDVKSRQGEIRQAVEQAAQGGALNSAYVRRIVVAANLAVRRALPIGANQGASIVVAFAAGAGAATQISYFVLGDCSVWRVTPQASQRLPGSRDIYLGDPAAAADDLAYYTPKPVTIAADAGESIVLTPAHYSPPALTGLRSPAQGRLPAATLAGFGATALIVSALIVGVYLGLANVSTILTQLIPTSTSQVESTAAATAAATVPTVALTIVPVTVAPTIPPTIAPTVTPAVAPSSTPTPPNTAATAGDDGVITAEAIATAYDEAVAARRLTAQALPPTATLTPPALALAGSTTPGPTASPTLTGEPTTVTPASAVTTTLSLAEHGVNLIPPTGGENGNFVFSWNLKRAKLPLGYQYELVFWNPNSVWDKKGPKGVTTDLSIDVDLDDVLLNNREFSTILSPGREFCWGVRAWNTTGEAPDIMLSGDDCQRIVYTVAAPQDKKDNRTPDVNPHIQFPTETPMPVMTSAPSTDQTQGEDRP